MYENMSLTSPEIESSTIGTNVSEERKEPSAVNKEPSAVNKSSAVNKPSAVNSPSTVNKPSAVKRPSVVNNEPSAIGKKPLAVKLRSPLPADGAKVFKLVAASPPLDPNSIYCNLLQCSHFSSTSVAAVNNSEELIGFISGYRIPERPETLFIWQVAVASQGRGQGLATRMLNDILQRQRGEVTALETTITESNQASWSLFKGMAKKLSAPLNTTVMFDRKQHFHGAHETEMLVRIGPFSIPEKQATSGGPQTYGQTPRVNSL